MFTPEFIPPKPLTLAQAIALVEGWYAHGTSANRPQRNNNPGDIEFHDWMTARYGAVLEAAASPRFAHFPSAEIGWKALNDLLASDSYKDLTIAQAVNRFAPPTENNDAMYVDAVCRWTGRAASEIVSA